MDILVAGAGIGGLALAHGLRDDPRWTIRVFEQAPALRTGGAAVTIFSNGAAALAALGAPLGDLGGRIDTLRFLTPSGEQFFAADLTVMERKTGFPIATVPRNRLIAHLAQGLSPAIIHFGRSVSDVEPGLAVIDSQGDRHRPDVLVGADGHRSVVRQATVSEAPARDCGWTTWQGLTPILPQIAEGTTGVCVVGPAGLCGLMPAGDGLVQWWFDVSEPIATSPTTEIKTRFRGYGGLVAEALNAISDSDIEAFQHVVHDVPDQWGTGASTLVGDAAHVFPPTQAQGANQALEDAWLLTKALKSADSDIPAALRRYEAKRAPRVRRVSKLAATESTNKPLRPLAAMLAKLTPPKVAGAIHTRMLMSFSSVLRDESV